MPTSPRFIKDLQRMGLQSSVVSIDHLQELVSEIKSLHDLGLLHDDVFTTYMIPFTKGALPKSLPDARSIIVVATPQPMLRATFHYKDSILRAVVPPTYFDYGKVTWRARNALKEAFRPETFKLVRASLPLKLLAVRSGVALYGKNNITYIPKHGSLHRLTAFFSDYDSPVDYWQDKKPLPLCAKCRACFKACPTGAIQRDRFLIKADICLTFLNEKESEHAFPKWVKRSAHNALIGCMRCQMACPYDRELRGRYEDRGEFSEEETAYILKGRFTGQKAARMEKKLKSLGLDLTVFPRNLKVLLDSEAKDD